MRAREPEARTPILILIPLACVRACVRAPCRRLSNLVATAKQSQQFFEGLGAMRERVVEKNKDKEPIPIFNKRLFTAHGNVVITCEARRLMVRNASTRPGQHFALFTKQELQTMRCVVDGLRLIHRGQDYVKDALSHVVTFENYSPYQYIVKRPFESQLSCYYIMHGAVQVTYDMDVSETRNVFQPDIIYNHGTGEYLGLVSLDGLSDDLSPPATVYTTEPSEFLRIDRQKFHECVERIGRLQREEKLSFLTKPFSPLCSLPPDALEKVFPHVHKMDYAPNKTILQQGDTSEYLYFIMSGRCKLSRDVFVPEMDKEVCFYIDFRAQDDFFGEECILEEDQGSLCHVTTTSHTSCFLMHRAALQVVHKDSLLRVLESKRHHFPPDQELRDRGYQKLIWEGYKHREVHKSLQERGCLYIMSRDKPEQVKSRPPSSEFQHRENLFRFMAKGANYQPVVSRVHSAMLRTPDSNTLPLRPSTALGINPNLMCRTVSPIDKKPKLTETPTLVTEVVKVQEDEEEDENDGKEEEEDEKVDDVPEKMGGVTSSSDSALGSMPITTSFVRLLEKNLPKGVLQKLLGNKGVDLDPRVLGRAMEENPELGRQLRLAWEMHQQDKNDGFTKTTVLVTMKTDDIVRKAKALAEKHNFAANDDADDPELWNSSLHRENKTARLTIAGDKLRAAFLRKKITGLQLQRAKERADQIYRAAKPGEVPSKEERMQGNKTKKMADRFYLDEIQKDFQGLDPDAASKKVASMGSQALFLSKIWRRSRSVNDLLDDNHNGHINHKSQPSVSGRGSVSEGHTPARRDSKQEWDANGDSLRRSSEEMMSRMHGHKRVSIQKDAPVTLRSLTMPGQVMSKSEGDVILQRRLSRDVTAQGQRDVVQKRLPHPKLQLNR